VKTINDELSIKEIWNTVVINWIIIAVTAMFYAFAIVAYYLLVPDRYESIALVEIGKIADVEIEKPDNLAEKLKLPNYFSVATYQKCAKNSENISNSYKEFNKNITVKIIRGSIIGVTHRSNNQELSIGCLNNIFKEINKIHDTKIDVHIFNKTIEATRYTKIRDDSIKNNKYCNGKNENTSDYLLNNKIIETEGLISGVGIVKTSLVVPAYSEEDPYNKNTRFLMLLWLLLTITTALFISIFQKK